MRQFVLIGVFLLVNTSQAADYKVFTTTFLPGVNTEGYSTSVYYLNLPELILARLGYFQQGGAQNAKQQALTLLASTEGKQILSELGFSFDGILSAWAHDITHLPAILVDDDYLIYGVYELAEAEQLIDAFRLNSRWQERSVGH